MNEHLTKQKLRVMINTKQISIAEIVRQTNASRRALVKFRDTGEINPATFARVVVNLTLPKQNKRKGEP